MDFLGVGPMEFFMVALIALLVLGPNRVVNTARSAGRFWGNFQRGWSSAIQDLNIDTDLRLEELAPDGQRPYKPDNHNVTGTSPENKEEISEDNPG